MATYTTDLTLMADFETVSGTLAEPAATWIAGRSPVQDTDFPIQGTDHASLTMNTTGKAGLLTTVTTFTWTTGHYLFGWLNWWAPSTIATKTAGGLSMLAGSSVSDFKVFYVGGSDYGSYPYGGWQNFAVDPTATGDETIGTTPTAFNVIGAGANVLTKVAKGNPLGFDVFRYGRGEFRVNGTAATFSGMATANDASLARWGLFQQIEGGYKAKGLMILGYASAVTFSDSSKSIVFDTCMYTGTDFNQIEIRNAASSVTLSGVNVTQLGVNTVSGYDTVSKCLFVMTDNATVDISNCAFTDMSTFTFLSNATLSGTTFRRCGIVALGGASITGGLFDDTTGTSALQLDSTRSVTGVTFVSADNAEHAIYIDEVGTYTISSCVFTNYDTANGGSNTVIYNNSGGAVTVNISGNTGTVSYTNGASATTSVQASSSIDIHVQNEAKTDISGAYVYINDDDSGAAEVNTTTDANGDVSTSYSGSATTSTLRVRVYGYKPFKDTVDLSADINRTITLVADPQQT